MLDRETGLPIYGLGCVVDGELLGREEGYNARIKEHIAAHGPPASSFKKYERELFDLKAYFEERARTEEPIRLEEDGPEVRSPDESYGIRLAARTGTNGRGEPTRYSVYLGIANK